MPEAVETTIYKAWIAAAQALVLPAGWDLALPGIEYSPTAASRFVSVEVHFNRSIETDLSLELDPIRQGFVRTNVMLPKGRAVVDAYEVAGQLRAAFRRGTRLSRDATTINIDEDPELGPVMTSDTHHTIPVTTRWVSYP